MILDGGNSTCENLEAPGDESCGGGSFVCRYVSEPEYGRVGGEGN